jgi:four helix bundle protein
MMKYDLEERTEKIAYQIRVWCRSISKNLINLDDIKQLLRSSGSVAANYIEANESLSRKDFVYRIKICRKEAKESQLWLRLIEATSIELKTQQKKYLEEYTQLIRIFSTIISSTTKTPH